MKKFLARYRLTFPLLLLLILSLTVRLYRIGLTQTFLEDEGRDMLIVKRMIDTRRPVLIGPQTSTGSMYLGPFYYYFITPALILSHLDPVGPAILIAFTGMITVYLIFHLASNWLGDKSAWIAAIFYALMPLPVLFTRNSWNPNLVPLVTVLLLMVLDHLHAKKSPAKWWIWVGFLVGILLQLHYMALILVGLIALILTFWELFPFKLKNLAGFSKSLVLGIVGFVIALSPFFIFEIRNNWVNTHAITRFIEAKDEPNIRYHLPLWLWEKKTVSTTNSLLGGLFGHATTEPDNPLTPYLSGLVILAITLGLATAKLKSHRRQLLAFFFFGSLAILGIYQENIHRHYLGFLFPLAYLGVAALASSRYLWLRRFGVAVSAGLVLYCLPLTYQAINSGQTHQKEKALAVAEYIESQADGSPYNIVTSSEGNTAPYQYYAFTRSNPPTNTLAEDVFLICEGNPCSEDTLHSRQLFLAGPPHPTLEAYLGHPLFNDHEPANNVISNEHVKLGVWVAHLKFTTPE